MKKSSFFVTILLVVALCFAVSCEKGPQVSITAISQESLETTVDSELASFTFDIEVANGAFSSDALNQTLVVKGSENFSGEGESEKVAIVATITKLGEKDVTTQKVTKATVTVAAFTPKASTNGAKDLTFEIPEVKADGKKILEDTTKAVAIGGKKVSIAVNPKPIDVEVKATPTDGALTFTKDAEISGTNTVVYELKGASWKSDALPTVASKYGLSFAFVVDSVDSSKLTLTVTGTPNQEVASGEDFSFDIKSSVTVSVGGGYVIPNELKAPLKITISAS